MIDVFIGLGSNLDNPQQQLRYAIESIQEIPNTVLCEVSPFYQSAAIVAADASVEDQNQPDYVNAVVWLETELDALELLNILLAIEAKHGRVRTERRWQARTLDLDLLLYGDCTINEPDLIVPHPRLHERAFVIYPLSDIAPNIVIPELGPLKQLLQQCPRNSINKLRT